MQPINKDFGEYFRKYYQALSYFAYNILKDKDLSEDVVQNVFLKIINDNIAFEDETHRRQYLYKSVRNACLNEIKRLDIHSQVMERLTPYSPEDTETQNNNNLFSSIVRAEVYREIITAIDSLPTECKKVFKMAYIENLDNQDIADVLSISINTVKVQKNKAKKKLRQILKDIYPLVFFVI